MQSGITLANMGVDAQTHATGSATWPIAAPARWIACCFPLQAIHLLYSQVSPGRREVPGNGSKESIIS